MKAKRFYPIVCVNLKNNTPGRFQKSSQALLQLCAKTWNTILVLLSFSPPSFNQAYLIGLVSNKAICQFWLWDYNPSLILLNLGFFSYLGAFGLTPMAIWAVEFSNGEYKIRKIFTSQNFNSFRQFLFPFFLLIVWSSWDFVRFHDILFQTDAKNFSSLSWKTKKLYH